MTHARSLARDSRLRWYLVAALGLTLSIIVYTRPSLRDRINAERSADEYFKSSNLTEEDFANPLDWRAYLERTTSSRRQVEHHPTLGFSHIYVLSLPTRTDRRAEMDKLARALGCDITYIDATPKNSSFITWIGERVVESRALRREVLAKARNKKPEEIGSGGFRNGWFSPYVMGKHPFPPFPEDSRFPGTSWSAHLNHMHDLNRHTSLKPDNASLDLKAALRDPIERPGGMQIDAGIIASYWTHLTAIKRAIAAGDESALILEDDVDVEWDLERLWSGIAPNLPEYWDVTYLGHCWGQETRRTWQGHPLLFPSVQPLCIHAYAVSAKGAQRMMDAMLDPWRAFSVVADWVGPTLIHHGLLNSFSVQPQLIIQRKDGTSDLRAGGGTKWRGVLRDSTVARIARDEDNWAGEEKWDPSKKHWDPATRMTVCV